MRDAGPGACRMGRYYVNVSEIVVYEVSVVGLSGMQRKTKMFSNKQSETRLQFI